MRGAKVDISIHAPHARSDRHVRPRRLHIRRHFNPRSSCEERLEHKLVTFGKCSFQSTLLMRGATQLQLKEQDIKAFQSTLLMRGATVLAVHCGIDSAFQSTLLMRGATTR